MNEEDTELEHDTENPTIDMVDFIQNAEFNKASIMFNDILSDKISDALDQERIAVASNMFNQGDEQLELDLENEQEGDDDISDEDLELAAQEVEDLVDTEIDDEDEDQ